MSPPILSIRDLRIAFASDEGRVEALSGVSFDIPARQTVALVGESGSGKTVISHAILGILGKSARIESGSILFNDPDLGGGPVDLLAHSDDSPFRRSIRGGRISIIFQEPMSSLSPLHTIGDQISEAYLLHSSQDGDAARTATIDMLDKVGFPNPASAFDRYPFELSGGLRQRAMIAMALVCRPALLIADEPTTALDVTIQAQILKLLVDLQDELHMGILFITHDLGVVANLADEMVVMHKGELMERGALEPLIRHPEHPYLKALMGAVPRLHMDPNERLTTVRDFQSDTPAPGKSAPLEIGENIMLDVQGLQKTFALRQGGMFRSSPLLIKAVDDVSFKVRQGECFAIVGESGSGKTTVAKMIMRALEPDAGVIRFSRDGVKTEIRDLDEAALIKFRRELQYIFQDPFGSLNPRMTVRDIVTEPLVIHGIGTEQEQWKRAEELLVAVGMDSRHLIRYPHSFSGGQRQRIGIARALALHPRMLICDEPVSALDVSVQAQILNLLKDLQRDLGLTYLFISHNLAVVKYIAQTVGVMCAGRMVEMAPTDQLFNAPRHPYTKALLAAVPEPDLDNLLDFQRLMDGKGSDPAAWPDPFCLTGKSGRMVEEEKNHFVRKSLEAV